MSHCKFLWGNPCRAIETFYRWDFFLLDAFLSFCCMKEFGGEFGCVIFPRLSVSWRKLQLSPLEHCPLDSHCQQFSKNSLYALFCSLILDHGVLKISIPAPKIFISYILLDTSCHHRFQSVIIRSSFLLMDFKVIQFQFGLELNRLSYSSFVQSFQDVIRWEFRHRQ